MEEYSGVKFQVIFQEKSITNAPQIDKLKNWGKQLSKLGFIPHYKNEQEPDRLSSAGNLSFRMNKEFVITASYSDLSNLRDEDFIHIKGVDLRQKKIWVNGKREPSSETMLHYSIYQKRNDINAIFHGHSTKLLNNCKRLGLKSTLYEAQYGSLELVNSVLEVLEDANFLIIKNHGFLSFGRTITQAGENTLNIYRKLEEIT